MSSATAVYCLQAGLLRGQALLPPGTSGLALVAHYEARAIVGELRRIGTNINQIARQLNTQGAADGVQQAIAEVVEHLRGLHSMLGGLDGAR